MKFKKVLKNNNKLKIVFKQNVRKIQGRKRAKERERERGEYLGVHYAGEGKSVPVVGTEGINSMASSIIFKELSPCCWLTPGCLKIQ
jgi:hypothetical protein